MEDPDIIYTKVDEAPELASASLLPIIQTFAKAAEVTFLNKDGEHEHPYATSWGVSTRLIGALIMV